MFTVIYVSSPFVWYETCIGNSTGMFSSTSVKSTYSMSWNVLTPRMMSERSFWTGPSSSCFQGYHLSIHVWHAWSRPRECSPWATYNSSWKSVFLHDLWTISLFSGLERRIGEVSTVLDSNHVRLSIIKYNHVLYRPFGIPHGPFSLRRTKILDLFRYMMLYSVRMMNIIGILVDINVWFHGSI